MSPYPAIRFLDPLVTDYNSMDVDDSSMGWESLDQSDPGQADDAGCLINPDLYLGPEDDVIDVDELPDAADPPIFDPATLEVSISYQPELDFEEVHLMAQELHYFGKYQHPECLPDPSLQQLLEAERPFQTAWAETSNKLKKADADLQRLQRVEQMSIEMVVDSLIEHFEEQ
ncbi:hypothetical protein BDR03DRAFT_983673 [Suillus americanus]|nr:hypothetical protein BDR03DRAFT_983673 [Suillus americanus]